MISQQVRYGDPSIDPPLNQRFTGRWKLFGVSIIPVELVRVQPAPPKH